MKNLIHAHNDFSLWEIKEKNELQQINQFVLKVYYYHHLRQKVYPKNELLKMVQEDVDSLSNSSYYVAFDNEKQIVGTIKTQKWNQITCLSIEKDFGVNLKKLIQSLPFKPNGIYHIGRFAIDQDMIRKNANLQQNRLTILKLLMYYALISVYKEKSNIFLCECDYKLFSKLNFLGIYPQKLGIPKGYLGSKTIPVFCDYNGIKDFFNQNKNLIYV
jgi:hypothetical protein